MVVIDTQHDLKNKFTHTAIHLYFERLMNFIDIVGCPVGIFSDVERVFDLANHGHLINKMSENL